MFLFFEELVLYVNSHRFCKLDFEAKEVLKFFLLKLDHIIETYQTSTIHPPLLYLHDRRRSGWFTKLKFLQVFKAKKDGVISKFLHLVSLSTTFKTPSKFGRGSLRISASARLNRCTVRNRASLDLDHLN